MANSLLNPDGIFEEPIFLFDLNEGNLAMQYGIIATDMAIEESETTFTTTTTGGDVYIYCTGQKPVMITLAGCIAFKFGDGNGTCLQAGLDFRDFYENKRIGKSGNSPLMIKIGEKTYTACLIGYSRKSSSTPDENHTFNLKFVGVSNE